MRTLAELNTDFTRLNVFDTGVFSHAAQFFPTCKFHFMSLAGDTILRENFYKLLGVHKGLSDKSSVSAASVSWIDHLKIILRGSHAIVNFLEAGESVLIQHRYLDDI